MSETGHAVDFKKTTVQAQAGSNGSRLVQVAWLSGPNVLDRSIEPYSSFIAEWHKLQHKGKRRQPAKGTMKGRRIPQCGTNVPGVITRSRACVKTARIT